MVDEEGEKKGVREGGEGKGMRKFSFSNFGSSFRHCAG